MKNVVGIYAIKNSANGCVYIGSSVNVGTRWSSHRTALARGTHENRRLQRAWMDHGGDAFEFVLIEECAVEEIEARELHWLNEFRSLPGSVYNRSGDPDRGRSRRQPPKPKEPRKSISLELSLYEAIAQIAEEDTIFGRSVTGVVREAILRYSKQLHRNGTIREDYARNVLRAYVRRTEEEKQRPGHA
jgi:group I intron endonuclease